MLEEIKNKKQEYQEIISVVGDFEPEDTEIISNIEKDYNSMIRCINLVKVHKRQNKDHRDHNIDKMINNLLNGKKVYMGC